MISLDVNQQPPEKQSHREDGALDVHSIFPTIQGEGPFVGMPAVFLRLAACNLQCPACDTDYTSGRHVYDPMEVLAKIDLAAKSGKVRKTKLVVITGGEPFRQNLAPLLALLRADHYQVQVETNGTLAPQTPGVLGSGLTIVCSPKTPKLAPELHREIDFYKYIIRAGEVDPTDGLPTSSLNYGLRPARPLAPQDAMWGQSVYVQPMDEADPVLVAANHKAAVDSCLKFGYILCLQIHKIVNLP